MNFYLVPGDNEEPIAWLAIDAGCKLALAGTSGGSLLAYGLDGGSLEPVPLARRYRSIGGLAFAGDDAIALGLTKPATADIVHVLPNRTTEIFYSDAPHPFSAIAFDCHGSLGLIAAGEQLLRYYPKERSYLPVETPEGWQLGGLAFEGKEKSALIAGRATAGEGFLARFSPSAESGGLTPVPADGKLPPLKTVACAGAASRALAAGPAGTIVALDGDKPARAVSAIASRELFGLAFHPSGDWALAAAGPAAANKGAELVRIDWPTLAARTVYEGPPGAGPFTAVAFAATGDRALAGGQWGQIVEIRF